MEMYLYLPKQGIGIVWIILKLVDVYNNFPISPASQEP